jgi:hypothetical protein
MRLFLSYPSEVRSQVEEVAIRLRAAGHRVFFAPGDLPSGDSFDDRIRRAIRQSDVFLCFLTPEFVTAGRYTLSELEIAKQKWPSPAGHVLPVRLQEVPIEAVPAYLRAVTILDPRGNLAADVIAAISGVKTRHSIKRVATAFALLALVLGLFLWYREPHLYVAKPEVRLEFPGYAGNPDQYAIGARSTYRGTASDLKEARVEFLHPEEGEQSEWDGESLPLSMTSGAHPDLKFAATLQKRYGKTTELRVCALVRAWSCSPWASVNQAAPEGQIPEAILRRITAVTAVNDSFFAAMTNPTVVAQLGSAGEVLKSTHFTGTPTALVAADTNIYVATAQPDAVAAFDLQTLEPRWQLPIEFTPKPGTAFNEAQSTEVHSMAANSEGVWINTGQGSGSVLAHADPTNRKWIVPKYQDDIAFDLRDVVLATAGNQIWGAETNSTPANAYLFYPSRYVLLDGHAYDEVGCASGAGTSTTGGFFLINCDGSLIIGDVRGGAFKVVKRGAVLANWPASSPEAWTTYIAVVGTKVAVAANVEHPNLPTPGTGWTSQIYAAASADVTPRLVATIPGVHVNSIAVAGTTVLAALIRSDRSRQGVAISLK